MTEKKKPPRVGVIMGGRSSEREVSLRTGAAVKDALLARGHDAVAIDLDGKAGELIAKLRAERVDVAWIALHGTFGEDGCVQGLLEIEGVPYTGSGVLASALAMDKVVSKRVFDHHGIRTPRWAIHNGPADLLFVGMPLVVKPSCEGSSVGVTLVREERGISAAIEEAERHHGAVLLEQLIEGHDLSVGILDDEVLGTVEIRPKVEFYDYQAKYERKDTEYLCPAPLSPERDAEVRRLALAAHRALGCAGASRVDMIDSKDGEAFVLEVNTLPGMTATSLLPKIARSAGLSYDELVERILLGAKLKA
jgi:D-alanine-D-alanine ligase